MKYIQIEVYIGVTTVYYFNKIRSETNINMSMVKIWLDIQCWYIGPVILKLTNKKFLFGQNVGRKHGKKTAVG